MSLLARRNKLELEVILVVGCYGHRTSLVSGYIQIVQGLGVFVVVEHKQSLVENSHPVELCVIHKQELLFAPQGAALGCSVTESGRGHRQYLRGLVAPRRTRGVARTVTRPVRRILLEAYNRVPARVGVGWWVVYRKRGFCLDDWRVRQGGRRVYIQFVVELTRMLDVYVVLFVMVTVGVDICFGF